MLLPEVPRLCLKRAISQMRVHQVLLLAGCCVEGNREAGQASRCRDRAWHTARRDLLRARWATPPTAGDCMFGPRSRVCRPVGDSPHHHH